MRRTWLVLLLLAAIFSMHGISSLPRDAGLSWATSGTHSVKAVAADEGLGQAGPASVVDESMGGAGSSDHGGPAGHGVTAHLWSLCLAVLFAGVALVVLLLTSRTSSAEKLLAEFRRVRGPAQSFVVLRPPDLSELCLLRI